MIKPLIVSAKALLSVWKVGFRCLQIILSESSCVCRKGVWLCGVFLLYNDGGIRQLKCAAV